MENIPFVDFLEMPQEEIQDQVIDSRESYNVFVIQGILKIG